MPSIMTKPRNQNKPIKKINQSKKLDPPKAEKPPSWAVVRGILTCKHSSQTQQQHEEQKQKQQQQQQQHQKQKQKQKQKHKLQQKQGQAVDEIAKVKCKKMKCSGSLCSNTKVMHRPETGSPEVHKKRAISSSSFSASSSSSTTTNTNNEGSSNRSTKSSLNELSGVVSTSTSSSSSLSMSSSTTSSVSLGGGSFRGMPFRRFSGCYECRMVVDPVLGIARDPSLRGSICSCPECGEIFMKPENLELHQAVRHAVSELGPEDTSKNIVEIIFQSSWLRKQAPVCKIDRILKVHNTQRTITRFEEYRDAIKAKATKLPNPKKNPRCVADGNELLRFHCATFRCSLGLNGSSNLCNSIPSCTVCAVIKNGFKAVAGEPAASGGAILTTATSGKAHDSVAAGTGEEGETRRAMLVCRVIAGRVKKTSMEEGGGGGGLMEEYDSVGGDVGVYSNLDELYVFNPRAILPCFVVIYRGF